MHCTKIMSPKNDQADGTRILYSVQSSGFFVIFTEVFN